MSPRFLIDLVLRDHTGAQNLSPLLYTWMISFSWQNTKNKSTEEWSFVLKLFGNYYFTFEYLSWNVTLIFFSFPKGQAVEDPEVRHLDFYKHHTYISYVGYTACFILAKLSSQSERD